MLIVDKRVFRGGIAVMPTLVLPVSWSADHRVIDGACVARLSNLFKDLCEYPHKMLSKLH